MSAGCQAMVDVVPGRMLACAAQRDPGESSHGCAHPGSDSQDPVLSEWSCAAWAAGASGLRVTRAEQMCDQTKIQQNQSDFDCRAKHRRHVITAVHKYPALLMSAMQTQATSRKRQGRVSQRKKKKHAWKGILNKSWLSGEHLLLLQRTPVLIPAPLSGGSQP